MVYKGQVKNGLVVLDEPATLPDGTTVSVRPLKKGASRARRSPALKTAAERFAPFIGQAKGLPSDLATNLDHYLYGAPKRK